MDDDDDRHEIPLERWERALAVVAYVVMRHGNAYLPILERLEREVERARRDDPRLRAQRILENYTAEGGRNAILPSHSALISKE